MAIVLSPIMMHYSVEFIGPDSGFLVAGDLQDGLDLYYVIDLGEVHVLLAKHEALEVDYEAFGQRVNLGLL